MVARPAGYRSTMSELEGSPIYEEGKAAAQPSSPARPQAEGVPTEESMNLADIEERLDEEPEEAVNRRDVPDDPEERHPQAD